MRMPLTDNDLKKIGDLQTVNLLKFWDQVLEPALFTKDGANEMEDRLNQKIMRESQDTRDHTTRVVADSSGASVQRDRTLNAKTDAVAFTLEKKKVFTQTDVADIVRIAPVAVAPAP